MRKDLDLRDINSILNYVGKYGDQFADGTYSNSTRTKDHDAKMDLGIRDTLYKGFAHSESFMSRGQVMAKLELMMNTESYREEFEKTDPERYAVYKLAYNEFLGDIHSGYPSPPKKEEVAADALVDTSTKD